uniref:Uncharacterized protein n=1 Tax=Trypanosoma congolense (strain IL3000) TaxID=1068625 RepID=G0UUK6_TRYCI|nr:hypothetical protein, unlikely [Trypanosoma congolense IL3000]
MRNQPKNVTFHYHGILIISFYHGTVIKSCFSMQRCLNFLLHCDCCVYVSVASNYFIMYRRHITQNIGLYKNITNNTVILLFVCSVWWLLLGRGFFFCVGLGRAC